MFYGKGLAETLRLVRRLQSQSTWRLRLPETAFKPGDAVMVVSDCEMGYHDGTLFYGTVGAILCEVVLGLHDIRYKIAVTHYKVVGLRWPVRHRFEIVDIHAADMNIDTERGV